FPTERTAPNSLSLPEVIVQGCAIWNHSPMSQYLPTRFQASAAGRLTSISMTTDAYDGLGVCSGAGAGACAAAIAGNVTRATTAAISVCMRRHYHDHSLAGLRRRFH